MDSLGKVNARGGKILLLGLISLVVFFVLAFENGAFLPKQASSTRLKYIPNNLVSQNALLNSSLTPNTVFYVWCGRRWFEFSHYLSVMSVIRNVQPDNIIFYYDIAPETDKQHYNTWFNEVLEEHPFIRRHQLTKADNACNASGKPNWSFIFDTLTKKGGMYVNEQTLIAMFSTAFRLKDAVSAINVTTRIGFLMAKPGIPGKRTLDEVLTAPRLMTQTLQCVHKDQFHDENNQLTCIYINKSLLPRDIWELDNSFGSFARAVFYGTPEMPHPVPTYDDLIPNIAHIIWLGGGEMDLLFYLCVLSLIHMAKVDAIYLHGDGPPRGMYWELIKNHTKLHLIFRERPLTIFGIEVKGLSHVSDTMRVDIMLKYGGIYVDTDSVFIRPLDREIRGYDAVASFCCTQWHLPFPNIINPGVMIGKPNAKFWQSFQESLKGYLDGDWSWNCCRKPYRILERHPDQVRIDPHLQVLCYKSLCHPTWWPNYQNLSIHHLNTNSIKNWREDTYAFHWTTPVPYELQNLKHLFNSKPSLFKEIGMTILEEANMLTYFKNLYKQKH